MKKLLSLILLAIFHLGVYAQNEVFRIDSIPQQGILLDKGWKFHAGDNPDFAKPDFDDSKWESIDPTKDIDELPEIKKAEIGWFRIKLNFDSTLKNTILSLYTYQNIATEFYQNGRFIGNFGKVSQNPNEVQAFFSFNYLKPVIHLYTGDKGKHIIAVRFAIKDIAIYQKSQLHKSDCLSIILNISDPKLPIIRNAFHGNNYEQFGNFDAPTLDYFKAGLFFILSILHFSFYYAHRLQKANIFFGLGCCFLFVFYIYQATVNRYFYDLSDIATFANTYWFIRHPAYIFQLTAVYIIFNIRFGIVYKVLILIVAITLILPFFDFFIVSQSRIYISTVIFFEVARISILVYRDGKDGAKIILFGSTCFVFLIIITTFNASYLNQHDTVRHILTNLGVLSIPISITLYLGREFAQISKSLMLKLSEVQRLSFEKQETLEKQNAQLQAALLQGQTIERKRVAADLHDNLGSTLSALWLSVDLIDKSKMSQEEIAIHQNLRENLEKAYNDVRLLSHNLLPEEFEKQGLVPTLQSFVRKISKNSKIRFDLQIAEGFGRVDNKIEFELYSICLELVNNIIKHSKASEAKISLSRTEKKIELIISDNGIGTFNNESDGKGMKNVKARVESLNGVWKINSKKNQGTNSQINIPI
ncbi:histidine kinase [Emticicia sp. SJ17W-69]|uniref:histidine kinase n=1 Tax=Emticicia sp. SJ17W-69 TaxID=3421657 RepID=UPI003EBD3D48